LTTLNKHGYYILSEKTWILHELTKQTTIERSKPQNVKIQKRHLTEREVSKNAEQLNLILAFQFQYQTRLGKTRLIQD
jgi:hypothetical protein